MDFSKPEISRSLINKVGLFYYLLDNNDGALRWLTQHDEEFKGVSVEKIKRHLEYLRLVFSYHKHWSPMRQIKWELYDALDDIFESQKLFETGPEVGMMPNKDFSTIVSSESDQSFEISSSENQNSKASAATLTQEKPKQSSLNSDYNSLKNNIMQLFQESIQPENHSQLLELLTVFRELVRPIEVM